MCATPHLVHAILDACNQPGCPVCRLSQQAVEHYLDGLLYENVNELDLRQYLRRSLGFCNVHSWQLLEFRDVLGIAIIYHDILGTVLSELPAESSTGEAQGWLRRLVSKTPPEKTGMAVQALTPRKPCPACQQQISTEKLILTELVGSLKDEKIAGALADSQGLCLPHLRQAIEHVQEESEFNTLLSISRKKLEALRVELGEFIRKSDYRFRQEGLGSERDSGRRAIRITVGEPLGKVEE